MSEENKPAEEVEASKPITVQDMIKAQKQIKANTDAQAAEVRAKMLREEIAAATAPPAK